MDTDSFESAVKLLANAKHICVSTGAGMSAESGVPTFRDKDGHWSKFNPAELASPLAFARNPQKVWAWYRERRSQLATVKPHSGHRVLADWERRVPQFTLVTQNVDGLHRRAGSQNVLELHGRLELTTCSGCTFSRVDLDDLGPEPRCEQCAARLRPGVVWFGEELPHAALSSAFAAAEACDVFVLIGTSGVVYPAAGVAEAALAAGVPLIEINPEQTPFSSHAAIYFAGSSAVVLVGIEERWKARTP